MYKRQRVGCLIEAPGLYGNMSAYDNLNIKCKLTGIKKKGYIEELLKTVGLDLSLIHIWRSAHAGIQAQPKLQPAVHCTDPVSYTHLDVYKRQDVGFASYFSVSMN